MSAATDALQIKTDDELRFFVGNPHFYQSELVEAARRELRRRGALLAASPAANPDLPLPPAIPGGATAASAAPTAVAAAATAPRAALPPAPVNEAAYQPDYQVATEAEQVPASRVGWLVALAVGLGLGGYGLYSYHTASVAEARQEQAATTAKLSPKALQLETVASYALPAFDVPELVKEQLASIPAGEKADEQALRQFRGMSERFWRGETQSEYLTNAAHTHTTAPVFADQARQARETWQAWNHAAVYTFKFGPVMSKQLAAMRDVASSQQHILEQLPGKLAGDKFLTDRELTARQTDVQAWMAGLRPTSPVTGKKYRVEVMQVQL